MPIRIREVKEFDDSVLCSLRDLLPQLTASFKTFKTDDLERILKSESTKLFIAMDTTADNKIVGTYTIIIVIIPTGSVARVEDVVVDEKWRGKGVGKMMMEHAIGYVRQAGVNRIELTSHSSRIAANGLYKSLGFTQIDTNVYRYYLNNNKDRY